MGIRSKKSKSLNSRIPLETQPTLQEIKKRPKLSLTQNTFTKILELTNKKYNWAKNNKTMVNAKLTKATRKNLLLDVLQYHLPYHPPLNLSNIISLDTNTKSGKAVIVINFKKFIGLSDISQATQELISLGFFKDTGFNEQKESAMKYIISNKTADLIEFFQDNGIFDYIGIKVSYEIKPNQLRELTLHTADNTKDSDNLSIGF